MGYQKHIQIFNMNLNKLFSNFLEEQEVPKGKKSNTLVSAITNRNPITFYYSGPKEPAKDSVKPGVRIRGEAVAMGLSKKGNVIIRTYVQPPSVSKKGYDKTNWRTFRIDRMSNIQILQDETFDITRPGYKQGAESDKGPMITTYVTTDWSKPPVVKKTELKTKPEIKPSEVPLPQPKTDDKPSQVPQEKPKDFSDDILRKIQPNIKTINGEKIINTQDFENISVELYKMKEKEWVDSQKQIGKNTNPGQGTRRRFEMTSKSDLSNLLIKNNIKVSDISLNSAETTDNLQESINRIKTLMFG
jgi:hypothetical protein